MIRIVLTAALFCGVVPRLACAQDEDVARLRAMLHQPVSNATALPPAADPSNAPPAAIATQTNFADELTDFGVPAQAELQWAVSKPTPTTIPGATVVATAELSRVTIGSVVLVDVLNGDPHESIPTAIIAPGGGSPGTYDDLIQAVLWQILSKATHMDPNKPIVFLCQGAKCWESYNAALRAEHMGFKKVYWYRGGIASWSAAGLKLTVPGNTQAASAFLGFPGFN